MATAELEIPYLAAHYAVPESNLSTLLEAPTTELVTELLQSITKKAREFEKLKAENRRLDVEIENAVRGNESKVRVLKGSVDKGLAEVAKLRESLHESGMDG